jgi:molybdopterin-guanine dinucleotide biosynthesis protein A
MAQRVGVVLAGGLGRRLGRPKGEFSFGDRSLAERAASILWPLAGSVLISTRPGASNPAPTFPQLEDPEPPGRGPLVGIDAAFSATRGADLIVLACDYPLVRGDLLTALLDASRSGVDVVLPCDFAGRDHPLVAVWARSAAVAVGAAVAERRHKVRALFAELRVLRLGPADLPGFDLDRILCNVNRVEDLTRLGARGA